MEKNRKKDNRDNEKSKRETDLGLDQDEQVMNGNYGMAETKEEDRQH